MSGRSKNISGHSFRNMEIMLLVLHGHVSNNVAEIVLHCATYIYGKDM